MEKLISHVSHEKVELHDHIIYLFNTLPIVALVPLQVVRSTTDWWKPHHDESPNICVVQILVYQYLTDQELPINPNSDKLELSMKQREDSDSHLYFLPHCGG